MIGLETRFHDASAVLKLTMYLGGHPSCLHLLPLDCSLPPRQARILGRELECVGGSRCMPIPFGTEFLGLGVWPEWGVVIFFFNLNTFPKSL